MKNALQFIWKLIKSNLSLKIMAVLFAVILWSYVLAATNPLRERVLHDIPVRPSHAEDLKANGLAISGSLSDALGSVDIRVKVEQNKLSLMSDQSFQAYVDLSAITGIGEYPLKVNVIPPTGVTVLEISPSEVTLTVDKLFTKQVPVNVKTTGSVPSGFYAGTPEISPDFVNITGAMADVEKVTSAQCLINLDLKEGYNKSVNVTLLDDEGNTVSPNLFSDNYPSVMVKLSVLPEKTVPIDASGSIVGQDSLAPGYEITGITCNPAQVTIIGEKRVLDGITSMALMPYSVSGLNSDVVAPLDYAPPEGVTVLDAGKAQVTVNIREITSQKLYKGIPVKIKNLPPGMDYTLDPAAVDVTVIAGVSRVSRLNKTDIAPFVDLDGLSEGTYSLSVQFEVPQGFTAENFSSSSATITVTIRKK